MFAKGGGRSAGRRASPLQGKQARAAHAKVMRDLRAQDAQSPAPPGTAAARAPAADAADGAPTPPRRRTRSAAAATSPRQHNKRPQSSPAAGRMQAPVPAPSGGDRDAHAAPEPTSDSDSHADNATTEGAAFSNAAAIAGSAPAGRRTPQSEHLQNIRRRLSAKHSENISPLDIAFPSALAAHVDPFYGAKSASHDAATCPYTTADDPHHAFCKGNPSVYDDFERNPASALLLLAHNTNLGSFPALQHLRDATEATRNDTDAFSLLIDDCVAELDNLRREIEDARPTQLANYIADSAAPASPAAEEVADASAPAM